MEEINQLAVGEVGFVVANIKKVSDTKIGDTITEDSRPTTVPFPGFQEIKPMVFSGLYPIEPNQYEGLRDALEKLRLNDSSFFYEPETSLALGFGFRCGFLGLLHMEIVQERWEREFDLSLITTAPGVRFRITKTNGDVIEIDSPTKMPAPQEIAKIEEPVITALIMTNDEYVGAILKLVEEKRGIQKGLDYVTTKRVLITYELPLNEIVLDFYDRLEIRFSRLCLLGLSFVWILDFPSGQAGYSGLGRIGRCPLHYHSSRPRLCPRPVTRRKNERTDSTPNVRSYDSGGHREQDCRARDSPGNEKECDCQVLRWGHHPQTKAPGKAEGRQEADETSG